MYQLFTKDDFHGINVLAHVAGGVAGYFYAFFFLKGARLVGADLQKDIHRSQFNSRF